MRNNQCSRMASMCSSLDRINMDIRNLLPGDGPRRDPWNLGHHIVLTWESADPPKRRKSGIRMAGASAPTVFSSPKFRHFDGYRMSIENAKRFFQRQFY